MSNDEIVRCIAANFVPVALNLYKIREAKDAGGDFFRAVQKQSPQYQGLWMVAPAGKVLASHQETKDISDWYGKWPKKVMADLDRGLKAFGPVKPRQVNRFDSLPHRGVGVLPGGGVTLAVYDKFVLVKNLDKDPPRDALGATVLDSIHLTAEEWSNLAPWTAETGSKWSAPEATARKFFPLLSTGDTAFRDSKEVTAVQFSGRVQKVEDGIAYLKYEGNIAATHHRTANEGGTGNKCSAEAKMMDGIGVYDVKAGKMLSLTLVFDGLWRNYPPYDAPARFGAVVEWRRERPEP